jgi:hypothetical protein
MVRTVSILSWSLASVGDLDQDKCEPLSPMKCSVARIKHACTPLTATSDQWGVYWGAQPTRYALPCKRTTPEPTQTQPAATLLYNTALPTLPSGRAHAAAPTQPKHRA